jgi:hypothetical protein
MQTVQLGTMQMMAESFRINRGSSTTIQSSGDILVKENNTIDVNIWDEEW